MAQGSTAPDAVTLTVAPDSTSWTMDSLQTNTQYAFQVAAVYPPGESLKTDPITAWTLANRPTQPSYYISDASNVYIWFGSGDGNPDGTSYGFHLYSTSHGDQWAHPDGTLSGTPYWQPNYWWGSGTWVQGLDPAAAYTITVVAYNGAGVASEESPSVELPGSFTVTYLADTNGYIDGATPQSVRANSWSASVTATGNEGYHFSYWSDGRTDNPRSDYVEGDFSVSAVFAPNQYTLSYGTDGYGYINGANPQTVEYGSDGTAVTAVPYHGYYFVQWSDGSTDNPRTDTNISGDFSVTATFAPSAEGHLYHTSDQNGDGQVNLSELLRVIQFFNSGGYHCQGGTEDGYAPGSGSTSCTPHDSDYNPQDWLISLSELLRVIQFFNSGGYHACPEDGTEDGFCPGPAAA